MTPPDSDERYLPKQVVVNVPDSGGLCIVCKRRATRGLNPGKPYWCDKHGPFYDKSDSGEREVPMTPATPEQNAKAEAILAELGGGVAVLPLSLAQRILAALEEQIEFVRNSGSDRAPLLGFRIALLTAIAAELREVMGK